MRFEDALKHMRKGKIVKRRSSDVKYRLVGGKLLIWESDETQWWEVKLVFEYRLLLAEDWEVVA